jgi:hypothetical protein
MPTVYELASLAAQILVNMPEAENDPRRYVGDSVQAAAELWYWAKAKVSELHEVEWLTTSLLERKKRALENVKPPTDFPVTMEKTIQGLLPKRSAKDRIRICRHFFDGFLKLIFPEMQELSEDVLNANVEFFMDHLTLETLTREQWERFAFYFQTWFPAYQRDLRKGKARKGGKMRQFLNNIT